MRPRRSRCKDGRRAPQPDHHHIVAGGEPSDFKREPSDFKRESAMLRSPPLMQASACMASLDSEAVLAQESKRSALHHRRCGATCERRGGNRGRIANRGGAGIRYRAWAGRPACLRRLGPARFGRATGCWVSPYRPHEQHVNLTALAGVTNVTGCSLHFLDG
jgi:hypothetical protein